MIYDEILQFTQVSVNSFTGMLYHNFVAWPILRLPCNMEALPYLNYTDH